MNPYDQAKLDAIERDRKRREDELLLALLLLCDEARNDAYVLLKHGQSPQQALQSILGRATGAIALAMADAYRDGVRRMAVLADESIPQSGPALREWKDENAEAVGALVIAFRPAAQEATNAMVNSIGESLADKASNVPLIELKGAVREAFDTAGYTARNPFALDLGAERAVVTAHNNGMLNAAGIVTEKITGLRHVSVLDDRTTMICRERDGLMYPLDDPYWQTNVPALHWNCRSSLLPVFGDFIPSERYPVTQPQPGFGYASAVFIQRLKGGLAA